MTMCLNSSSALIVKHCKNIRSKAACFCVLVNIFGTHLAQSCNDVPCHNVAVNTSTRSTKLSVIIIGRSTLLWTFFRPTLNKQHHCFTLPLNFNKLHMNMKLPKFQWHCCFLVCFKNCIPTVDGIIYRTTLFKVSVLHNNQILTKWPTVGL